MYMQIPCIIPKHKVHLRKIVGLMIACISVLIFLFIQLSLEYVKRVQANQFIDWDVKTISAADYTVEFGISDSQYEYFETKYLDRSSPISEIGQFRIYIQNEMEQRLTEFPALHLDGQEGDLAPVKIAVITFAFDNSQIIKGLQKRG